MTVSKDLFLLLADTDAQYAIETLLNRPRALGIRPIRHDRIRYVGRDAGCRKDCVESTCTDPAFAKFRATLQHWFPPP